MAREILLVALFGACVAACSAAEPPAPVHIAHDSPPEKLEEDRSGDTVNVTPIAVPSGLVVDGDLGEWGAFPKAPESLERPRTLGDSLGPPQKVDPLKNPERADSRIAFALNGQQAWIVGDLGTAAEQGIWVGVGTEVAEMPLLGDYVGRMGFVPLSCEAKRLDEGGSVREETKACLALLARFAEHQAQHAARFERLFYVDSTGVRTAGSGGKLAPVEGAHAAWRAQRLGATFEVSLPLTALPRAAEAPLEKIRLAARLGISTPTIEPQQWIWAALPSKVDFEPYAALRRHAIERSHSLDHLLDIGMTTFAQPRAASYQPGESLNLEVVLITDLSEPEVKVIPLFEPLGQMGALNIVRAAAPRGHLAFEQEPWLAVLQNDQVKEIVKAPGVPQATFTLEGELRVIAFEEHAWDNTPGTFAVLGFDSKGERRDVPVQAVRGFDPYEGKPEPGPLVYWESTEAFVSKDSGGFGWRGSRGGRGFEATWEWDAASKSYKGAQRKAVVKKKAPPSKPVKPAVKKAPKP